MKFSASAKKILKKYQIIPSKRLGQNFLIDKFALSKVISASELKPEDIVLEIGPGTGILTMELAKKARKVIAIEKDRLMLLALKETLASFQNIEVIHGDILKLSPLSSKLKPYKVIANLPFYLTAPVIRKFLEAEIQPELMVFVVQKEVAQRICSKPPKMNLLAVSVQVYAEAKIIAYISKTSFWPQPKVDSAIIKIIPLKAAPPLLLRAGLYEQFFKIVRSGFANPRKQIVNNLSRMLKLTKEETSAWLLQNNIKPTMRAEILSVEHWKALAKTITMKK